ncbi:hypothetical protein OROHE_013767 [Orobanche hederae]
MASSIWFTNGIGKTEMITCTEIRGTSVFDLRSNSSRDRTN